MSARKIPSILILCGMGVPLIDSHASGGESNRLGPVLYALRKEAAPYGYDVIGLRLDDPSSLATAIRQAPENYEAVIFDLGSIGLNPLVRSEIEALQIMGFVSQEMSLNERQGLPQDEFQSEYVDMINLAIGEIAINGSRQRLAKAA